LIFFSRFPENVFMNIFTHSSNSLLFMIEFQSSTKHIQHCLHHTQQDQTTSFKLSIKQHNLNIVEMT
jgi:hypothetical protein